MRSGSRTSSRTIGLAFALCALPLAAMIALTGCVSQPAITRYQSDYVPAGSLRLGQVMKIASRDFVLGTPEVHGFVSSSGIADSQIRDGSIVLARIYCCGGPTRETSSEVANSRVLFVPPELHVAGGDIVEYRVGHPAQDGAPALMNTVTRVVQRPDADDAACWWDPPNDKLWLRVLYCKWMPEQGWVKQGGVNPAWYKPLAGSRGG
jgi:hypothetical protein